MKTASICRRKDRTNQEGSRLSKEGIKGKRERERSGHRQSNLAEVIKDANEAKKGDYGGL